MSLKPNKANEYIALRTISTLHFVIMAISFLSILLTFPLMVSCKARPPECADAISKEIFPTVDLWLTITDSIGVDHGDSNLVFGMPRCAFYISEDRILIMDILKAKISIFDTNGIYLNSIGCRGSAPGEFLQPSWCSQTLSGGIVVCDIMAKELLYYDSNYVYKASMGPFIPSPPDGNVFLNDSLFVGSYLGYEMRDQDISAGFVVAMWNFNALEPKTIYYENLTHYDPVNLFNTEMIQPLFTMSPDGIVYISEKSIDEYAINAWNLDGSLLFSITEPYTRVHRTQEVIDQEREEAHNAGIPDYILNSIEPDSFCLAITYLGIGPRGNLWVALGYYNHAIFKVYDSKNGQYLYTVALEHFGNDRRLSISVNKWGFTAVDPMSDSWPRVYILNLVD